MNIKNVGIFIVCSIFIFYYGIFASAIYSGYPISTTYYTNVYEQDGEIVYDTSRKEILSFKETIKVANLELYPDFLKNNSYSIKITEQQIGNEEIIANFLLENGFAKIIDESMATEQELSIQEEARTDRRGIWGAEKPSEERNLAQVFFQKAHELLVGIYGFLKNIYDNNWWVKWVLAPVLSFPFVCRLVVKAYKKLFKTKKMNILFAGDRSAGKTTLNMAYLNPYCTESELLGNVPTRYVAIKK